MHSRFLILLVVFVTGLGVHANAVLAQSVPDTTDAARLATALSELADAIKEYTEATTAADEPSEVTLGDARGAAQDYGLRVFWTLVVFLLTYFVIRTLTWILDKLAESSARRRLLFKRLVPISRICLWAFAVFVVVRVVFDVDAQGLLAATAALGVAVGFAAQDLLKNIFGGLVIISDRPFQVGDKISVGGTYGEVTAIGLRSTRIVTPDDNLVSVPNAQVVDGQVSNANAGALDCQVVTDLYLPAWVDEQKAKKIAYDAAASSRYVYRNKPIVVIVLDEWDKEPVTHLKVKAYVIDTRHEFLLMSDITERARVAFRDAGLFWDAEKAHA
jgi:small-conductance mechanosensitive channel